MRASSRRASAGFTLIEVLAAILILGIVITTTLGVFLERGRRLRLASELILAHQALANEAEIRRRINFAALDSADEEFLSDVSILEPLEPFETEVLVEPNGPGRKDVSMTVSWNGGKRVARVDLIRVDTGGSNLW